MSGKYQELVEELAALTKKVEELKPQQKEKERLIDALTKFIESEMDQDD